MTLFLAVGLVIYLVSLDHVIRRKFESHRWNLPSRVYSDSLRLYPGRAASPSLIEGQLIRLDYRRVAGVPKSTGEFMRDKEVLTVFLHDFHYPDGEFQGYPVRMGFKLDGETYRVTSLQRLDTKENLKTFRLEPVLIASIYDDKMEDRTLARLSELPEALVQATIAIEDERFYEHRGIDPQGILRALMTDLLHMKAVQGGSTLTQQLVKNYFLSSEKTVKRKFNEILMAMLLELRYTKEEILEAYFNEIYFGQRGPISVTGVEEASRLYFSKHIANLSLAESALLAGMIRSPGEYSPFRNPDKARDRRNFILKTLRDKELIGEAEYEKAKNEKLILPELRLKPMQAPYFVDLVQTELHQNFPPDILKSQGLKIFTTLDMEAQEIAEFAVEKRLAELEKSRAKIRQMTSQGKLLQSAFVAVQPQTGAVRAYVGGRDYESSQFDRISQARRQPGSAFKPFVYLTALKEKKYTLSSPVEDTSFSVQVGGRDWKPQNYDHGEHGTVSVRTALEQSYNLATVRIAVDVGLNKIVAMAHEAGIESNLEAFPSLALGAFEVTPLEMARAYTIFPNQGTRAELRAIMSVVTPDGQVVERRDLEMKKVVSSDLSYLMNSALRGVLDHGTAMTARVLGFHGLAAGKTGTTSDYKDSWFVGYTPDLLAVAWVGFDDGTSSGLSGATGALPIWAEFMRLMAPAGASKVDFPATDNIVLVKISKSGKLYKISCGDPLEEAYIKGTEPEEECAEND